jgi:polysaccharide export outer membrane protein
MRRLLTRLRALLIALGSLVLASCAQDAKNSVTPIAVSVADAELTSGDYRIGPRDLLQVTVFQVPDLSRTVQVNNAGFVAFPLIGNVQVAGKTTDEAQREIAARLGKSYLRSPQVTVSVAKSGQRVTVNGAVKTPQVMTIDGRLTLSQAIASAGGLGETANTQRIHVARVVGSGVQDNVFDIDAIHAGKTIDPPLVGGDIIIVEESNVKVTVKTVKDLLPFAVVGTLLSDIRVKRDIVPIGHLANGLGLYRYRYAWDSTLYVGVIAQEVMEVLPAAVTRGRDGYLRVDYRQLGFSLQTWHAWLASNPDRFDARTTSSRHSPRSLEYISTY